MVMMAGNTFDPTIPAERIQAQYEHIYPYASTKLRAIYEYEIRLRGVEPRPPAAPDLAPRRTAPGAKHAPSIPPQSGLAH